MPHVSQAIVQARAEAEEREERLGGVSRAKNTQSAYEADWKLFSRWLSLHGFQVSDTSPRLMAQFLQWLEEIPSPRTGKPYGPKSIERAYAGVSFCLRRLPGSVWPSWKPDVVKEYLDGMRRRATVRGHRTSKKQPIGPAELLRMLPHAGGGLYGVRNRAILAFFWAAGRRRSAIGEILAADVGVEPEGLTIFLGRSKTDQRGKGETFSVLRLPEQFAAACPVRLTLAWTKAASIQGGLLFRSLKGGVVQPFGVDGSLVARIVQRCAEAIGLDPRQFGGHSLRRGLITTMSRAGRSAEEIAAHTNQRPDTIQREYIERDTSIQNNKTAGAFEAGIARAEKLAARREQYAEERTSIVSPTTLLDAMGNERAADEQKLTRLKRKPR